MPYAKVRGEDREQLPESLKEAGPCDDGIEAISEQIRRLDRRIQELGRRSTPRHGLRQVTGVGPKVALGLRADIAGPEPVRCEPGRGAYLGLVPARRQSGASDPQLRITKEGTGSSEAAGAIGSTSGAFGPDCDLKRIRLGAGAWGGANAKKRAVVAVARKLAVLLHHLWRSGEVYEPTRARLAATKVA